MWIEKLNLKNWRNIKNESLNFSPSLNLIVGQNGQGKTNLVEAIYFLLKSASFRFASNKDFISNEESLINNSISEIAEDESLKQNTAKAEIHLNKKELVFHLGVSVQGSKKNLLINNKKVSGEKISGAFPLVLFSPESLAAIKEGSEQRRLLLDEFLTNIDKNYPASLADFNRLLKQRNRFLKSIKENSSIGYYNASYLDSLNQLYLSHAVAVTTQRINGIRAILPSLNECAKFIFNRSVDISVEYVISGEDCLNLTQEETEKKLAKRLFELKNSELSVGSSLVGPHKHDIHFFMDNRDSRKFCSQGQQRALILSFQLAQIVYHRKVLKFEPILILDDVLSELDKARRESLLSFLSHIKAQIFVTTTDEQELRELLKENVKMIRVKNGHFKEQVEDKESLWVEESL